MPEWIHNRPVKDGYYIGVGVASKIRNPNEYQSMAKRNALNDLISEIKVTISSNSVLQQFQNNSEFRQQFESEARMSAMNTIEGYDVVDSWENQEMYWVYYRLSKMKYEEIRRARIRAASDRAEAFYNEALQMEARNQYMMALRLKVKALAAVQDFLSEPLEMEVNGTTVSLTNEVLNSIQKQLYALQISSRLQSIQAKVGKPVKNPIDVMVRMLKDTSMPVAYIPITMMAQSGNMRFGNQTETDAQGLASFSITSVQSKDPVQSVRIIPDIQRIIRVDSLNASLLNILTRLDVPGTIIRMQVEPVRVYFQGDEKNLGTALSQNLLEASLKKNLAEIGCHFTRKKEEADYLLKLSSDTKSLGIIWGKMHSAALDMTLILSEAQNDVDVFKDALSQIKGYQTTPENAGLDAYKTANDMMMKSIYPRLVEELLRVH